MISNRSGRAAALALLVALATGGCATTDGPQAVETASHRATAAVPATPTPAPTPAPTAYAYSLTCSQDDGSDIAFPDLGTAWRWQREEEFSECHGVVDETGTPDAAQAATIAVLPDDETLGDVYGLCAASDDYYAENSGLSKDQVRELKAELTLCPDKPHAKKLRANLKSSVKIQKARNNGTRFFDGTYRVGSEIKAGAYVLAETADSCYWARLDKAGNILSNNFLPEGTRAEVTIRSTDYSFTADGCGEWIRQ